jgi:hypothetical protein
MLEPFVKLAGIATHLCVRRTRRLQALPGSQDATAVIKTYEFANLFHKRERCRDYLRVPLTDN